jgi:hypothetical protein
MAKTSITFKTLSLEDGTFSKGLLTGYIESKLPNCKDCPKSCRDYKCGGFRSFGYVPCLKIILSTSKVLWTSLPEIKIVSIGEKSIPELFGRDIRKYPLMILINILSEKYIARFKRIDMSIKNILSKFVSIYANITNFLLVRHLSYNFDLNVDCFLKHPDRHYHATKVTVIEMFNLHENLHAVKRKNLKDSLRLKFPVRLNPDSIAHPYTINAFHTAQHYNEIYQNELPTTIQDLMSGWAVPAREPLITYSATGAALFYNPADEE